ncbi:uncharacterized protein M6B38_113920 [Iris pallida]|uniref:Uncharacterized protein n=1 Tax=Iris pallida TaxID=29817 RepID=A0AAX6IL82_IRIPA|nr:uncharacterized protein M6B38_113920 [Iris pallida]
MATEVSATEHTAEVVVEEIKETENVVNGGEEGSSQSKDLEGKKEEAKVKEDLGVAEQSATELEETPESQKGDAVAKDVKKEEDLKASNSEILACATEEKEESTEQESVTQAVEPAVEVHEKELKDHLDVANIPEPPTEEIEKSAGDLEEPSVNVSETEEVKEPAISAVPEEENPKELEVAKDPVVSAVSEEENPEESEVAEEPAISAVPEEENPTESQVAEEPAISAVSEEEKVTEEENPKESEAAEEPAISAVSEEEKVTEEENPKESEAAEEPAISAVSEEERPEVSEAVEEPVQEPANSKAVSEEHKLSEADKPTGETTVAFSVTETEDKSEPTVAPTATEPKITTITIPDDSGTAEISQVGTISTEEHEIKPVTLKEEPLVTDASNEEISNKFPEVPVSVNADPIPAEPLPLNELKEVGDEIRTSQEVPDVSEKTDANQISSGGVEESVTEENMSVGTDSSPVTEIVEGLLKPEDKVEEQTQEKIAVVKEPTLSGTTQTDDATEVSQATSEGSGGVEKVNEKMDETSGAAVDPSESLDAATEVSQVEGVEVAEEKNVSVEGDNTTSVQTPRDLDVGEGKDRDTTTVDLEDPEGKKEETEKAAEQNTVEPGKDGADNTKEVTAKPPHRQSNSIFSKVKHSIVKVKKAIIGKSPSSKTMTPEGNDDNIKVK